MWIAVDDTAVVSVPRVSTTVGVGSRVIVFVSPCTNASLLHHVCWSFHSLVLTCCHHGGRCDDRSA